MSSRRRQLSVPLLRVSMDQSEGVESKLDGDFGSDATLSGGGGGGGSDVDTPVRRVVRVLNSPVASVPRPLAGQTTAPAAFADNAISTRKYDPWITFVPLFLFDTFRKIANTYFLVVAALQCVDV